MKAKLLKRLRQEANEKFTIVHNINGSCRLIADGKTIIVCPPCDIDMVVEHLREYRRAYILKALHEDTRNHWRTLKI